MNNKYYFYLNLLLCNDLVHLDVYYDFSIAKSLCQRLYKKESKSIFIQPCENQLLLTRPYTLFVYHGEKTKSNHFPANNLN